MRNLFVVRTPGVSYRTAEKIVDAAEISLAPRRMLRDQPEPARLPGVDGQLQWRELNVIGAKRPSRAGADGEELEAPSFRFTLRKGKKGDGFESKLAKKQYGKKWLLAQKK